jgi:molybdate/tungstate transport system permease protein
MYSKPIRKEVLVTLDNEPKSKKIRFDIFAVLFILAGGLLLIFITLPILSVFLNIEIEPLKQTILDRETQNSLLLTFYCAAWATLLAFMTGVPLAYILARFQFRGKRWVEGLINLPIVIPHTAAGIALLMVFGRQTFIGSTLSKIGIRFVDQIPGIVVGMLFVSLPYLVNGSREAIELIDPELERVAETEGATRWQAFFHITLPLAWRGILASALMMWGRGISEFGAIIIIAYHPKVIPVLVYERFNGFGLAAAQPVAVVLILASLILFVLVNSLVNPKNQKNVFYKSFQGGKK